MLPKARDPTYAKLEERRRFDVCRASRLSPLSRDSAGLYRTPACCGQLVRSADPHRARLRLCLLPVRELRTASRARPRAPLLPLPRKRLRAQSLPFSTLLTGDWEEARRRRGRGRTFARSPNAGVDGHAGHSSQRSAAPCESRNDMSSDCGAWQRFDSVRQLWCPLGAQRAGLERVDLLNLCARSCSSCRRSLRSAWFCSIISRVCRASTDRTREREVADACTRSPWPSEMVRR